MRKIITPDDIPDRPSGAGSKTAKPKLSAEDFELQYDSCLDKVTEFLITKWTKGSRVSLDVTAYHDDVIKKIRKDHEETGAWAVERNLDRDENNALVVFLRFKSTRE